MKRIVVGIDGSQSSIQAARYAGELAEATGAELMVIYVLGPSQTPDGPTPAKMAAVRAGYDRKRQQRARERAEGALEGLRLSWSFLECLGDPAEQLEATADEEHADLVVVGAHGLGAAEALGVERLGWVATRMAHHGHRPVLVVR
jgi:nucleotide-binding universal stress UspA family protein